MNCQDRLGTNIASTISRYKETDKCCVLWYADVHCSVGWIRAATGAIPTIPPTASAATAPAAAAVTPHSTLLPSQKSSTTSPRAEKHPLFHLFSLSQKDKRSFIGNNDDNSVCQDRLGTNTKDGFKQRGTSRAFCT
jgi:hypothetical protein